MVLPVVVAAVVVLLMLWIGAAAATIGPWYRNLRKPPWTPPDWVFGPVWTIILTLAGWAGVLAWIRSPDADHPRIAWLFGANVVLHMLWSPLFFTLRRPQWALIEVPFLWFSIVAMMIGVAPYARLAVWLLVPYLLWVSFASLLNLAIVRRNRRPSRSLP